MKAFIVFIAIRVDIARGLQFIARCARIHLGYPFLVFNHSNRYTMFYTFSRAHFICVCARVHGTHNDGFGSILSGHLRIYNMIRNYIKVLMKLRPPLFSSATFYVKTRTYFHSFFLFFAFLSHLVLN